MLQGIELLSKEEIIETVVPDWTFIVPVLYVISVVGIAFCLFLIGKYFDKRELGLIAILVMFFGMVFTGQVEPLVESITSKEVATGRYEYTVAVTDPSAYKEIYENYEVISAAGDIYTIRDKEER